MPRRLELVIFDCDGVLVDSERLAVKIDAVVEDSRFGVEAARAAGMRAFGFL